ncbi:hypothetical protein Dimus_036713 [Dionaea muscipula]
MQRATAEEDEFRVKVVSRRSSRLSSSIPSDFSCLGSDRVVGLPTIEEDVAAILDCRTTVSSPATKLTDDLSSSLDDYPAETPLVVADGEIGVEVDVQTVGALTSCPSCSVMEADLVTAEDGHMAEVVPGDGDLENCESSLRMEAEDRVGEHGGAESLIGADLAISVSSVSIPSPSHCRDASAVSIDSEYPVHSLSTVRPYLLADIDGSAVVMLSDCGDMAANGIVSEEGLVSTAAREAMRSPPTDGRRQPPMSPVEPTLVAGRDRSLPVLGGGLPSGDGGLASVGRMGGRRFLSSPSSLAFPFFSAPLWTASFSPDLILWSVVASLVPVFV